MGVRVRESEDLLVDLRFLNCGGTRRRRSERVHAPYTETYTETTQLEHRSLLLTAFVVHLVFLAVFRTNDQSVHRSTAHLRPFNAPPTSNNSSRK